jgi:hypothetical protein
MSAEKHDKPDNFDGEAHFLEDSFR